MGVCGEVSGGPEALELLAKPRKMRLGRLSNMNVRQRQPTLKTLHHVPNWKRTLDHFAVRRDPHESEHGRPREPDAFSA
jgi:hypothetical protein